MIEFLKREGLLLLIYRPREPWITRELTEAGVANLRKKTFSFTADDVNMSDIVENEEMFEFVLGRLTGDYYEIMGRVLGLQHSVFLHQTLDVNEKMFTTVHGFSVFKRMSEIVREEVYVGGDYSRALPVEEFEQLLKDFPNYYEIGKYVDARLGAVLANYFEAASNVGEKYQRYMNKRTSIAGVNVKDRLKETEIYKYNLLLEKVREMLANETLYNEKQWQQEILQIILLLFPKYIYAFQGTNVLDSYSGKRRQLDIMLVDVNGHIDIIEIKKPFNEKILTKGTYRDNHIPMRELTGTVMQIEKYIFYLNKWGKKGEEEMTKNLAKKLPAKFSLKVTNPCGIVIMGRDNSLSLTQLSDFEVVKRKYKNIVDIITYDDLIRRLESILIALGE